MASKSYQTLDVHFLLQNAGLGSRSQLFFVNPLVPSAHKSARITQISIMKLEGIIKKISYEHRDYESVDEKAYLRQSPEKRRKEEIRH